VPLNSQQTERYSRQLILDGIGVEGQEKLLASKVLIVGAGGLGSPAALYLTAAGVGIIGLLDGDEVDLTNLQRQVIHHTSDLGRRKVESAAEKMRAINPDVHVQTYDTWARADNFAEIASQYDFVIDAVDNFAGKFLINDACYFQRKPFVHAGIRQFEGQLMTVLPGQTTCYRCIFPSPPAPGSVRCGRQAGVPGTVPAVIGSLQATEAIKYILGIGELLTSTLLTYAALTAEFRKVCFVRNPNCPLCSQNPRIKKLADEAGAHDE